MIALLAAEALASTQKVCIRLLPTWQDVPTLAGMDDYLTDNTDRPMRGIRIKVKPTGNPFWVTQHADPDGADLGCSDFTLSPGTYTIRVESYADMGDHYVMVRDSNANPNVIGLTLTTTWSVGSVDGTRTETINSGDNEWNILAALTWALHHRDGGLGTTGSPESWLAYGDQFPIIGGPGYDSTNDVIWLPSTTSRVALHEFGHYLFRRKTGGGSNLPNYSNPNQDLCFSDPTYNHAPDMKLTQAAAFHEGFANFYAVVSTNKETENNCFMKYYVNLNFDYDADPEDHEFNCDGIPWTEADGSTLITIGDSTNNTCITDSDYFDDIQNCLMCSTSTMANQATEYDYVRFFWDVYRDTDIVFGEMMDIIQLAEPSTWDGVDASAPFGDRPYERFLDAADAYDTAHGTSILGTWWSEAIANGVHR